MKKVALVLLAVLCLSGCVKTEKAVFKARIDAFGANTLEVTTIDYKDFDKASVMVTEKTKIMENGKETGFTGLLVNDEVEIAFDGTVRESYPVQITAKTITVLKKTSVYKVLSAIEAAEAVKNDKSIILLDVRSQEEFDEKHYKGALLIPDTQIEITAPQKLKDKNAKIFVYCRSGRRSRLASEQLIKMGYTQVFDIGGLNETAFEIVSELKQ